MEVEEEVRVVRTKLMCDKCGEGEMYPNGIVKPMMPPLYVHACTRCNHTSSHRVLYPVIEYEPVTVRS